MSLTATMSGFVVLLLTASVVQGENVWGVTYTSTEICALKGSTVEINCTYRYPSGNPVVTVKETFWLIKASNDVHVDLRTDPEYSGRVQYICGNNYCTLRITDLRESDSAEYKFRFTTNLSTGKYTGSPGVTLSVTDLQVQVSRLEVKKYSKSADLKCHSSCHLPDSSSYIWFKNGQRIQGQGILHSVDGPADNYSCAVKEHENSCSKPLLVLDQNDWGVTYTSTEICALKGSTVDISCTYRYPSRINDQDTEVEKRIWFTRASNNDYVDIETDPEYSGRVQYICGNNDCTLRITGLRESDSAQYKFRFITNLSTGKYTGLPGVTLSVKDPQLQIHVRRSTVNQYFNWTELTCHNLCQLSDHHSYIWYKDEQQVEGKKYFHPNPMNPAVTYSCAVSGYEGFRSPSVYAPRVSSVSVSPSGEIVEGSSVNLTCSSDANPAATYTWNKKNGNQYLQPPSKEPQLVFRSIQSSDSGEYNCTTENVLGRTSKHISINVKYAPRVPSVSVSPSGEIVEGSSVNLTCSSDANPAATYTWNKENQTLLNKEPQLVFRSIQSSDSGEYNCTVDNKLGRRTSKHISIDVKYAPRVPSVSVSPSGEIVEGSSVNLTCSSDANPAANYTWYKEDEDSPKASGQIFTITDLRAEHSGNYYCVAHNRRGSHNATLYLTIVAVSPVVWKLAVIGTAPGVFLVIIWLSVFLLIRKKRTSKRSSEPGEKPDDRCLANQSEEQDDLHYASIKFSNIQADPVYANIRPAGPRRHRQEEEEVVEYAAVKFNCAITDPRTGGPETDGDPAALYSTVNRTV